MRPTRRFVAAGLLLTGCATTAQDGKVLAFAAEDGVAAHAEAFGSGAHAVVLVPGAHGVGETWRLQAQRLARKGFRVLALDYRGLGNSRDVRQDDSKIHLDILGAVRWLRMQGAKKVSVVGASYGGLCAGTAALAAPGLIDRLVFLAHSAFPNPERLGGRKLFIVARHDLTGAGVPRLESIQRQFDATPDPKTLIVVEGSAHAQFLFLTDQSERVMNEIKRFLQAP